MLRFPALIALLTLAPVAQAAWAEEISLDSVNGAAFDPQRFGAIDASQPDPLVVKLQILLDRHHASPGVIDGRMGENVKKAIRGFEEKRGLPVDGDVDEKLWNELQGSSKDALTRYTITAEDMKGPFPGEIPENFRKMAEMKRLSYASPSEMFAERFHMDIDLLKRLNPEIEAASAGTEIRVANIGEPIKGKVKSIRVDRASGSLRALDADGKLLVSYPATIGSKSRPSPSGTHEVRAIAWDAAYYYDPKNFVADGIEEKLTLPPGPNNPIGSVWIDLSEPTYGIHGTPEPAEIDKEPSHGCVRLTNWDVEELAGLVEPGVKVEFLQ